MNTLTNPTNTLTTMLAANPLTEYEQLMERASELKAAALVELRERLKSLEAETEEVRVRIEKFADTPTATTAPRAARKARTEASESNGSKLDAAQLTAMLQAAPGKTISIRKQKLPTPAIKIIVAANPHLFSLGGAGAWPEVTLLK